VLLEEARALAELAAMELPQFVHEALIANTQKDRLLGHIARDSTAIEARERFPEPIAQGKAKQKADGQRKEERKRKRQQAAKQADGLSLPAPVKQKPGPRGPHRRYQGGTPKYSPSPETRLHRQRSMKLPDMLAELPISCSLGVKTKDGGNQHYWRGYKLHLDVADGQIPISAILTAASLHDSQVAIPLATMTAQRVKNLYDVMDAAYDATEIYEHSRSLGHVPIIRPVRRQKKEIPFSGSEKYQAREMTWAEQDRFRERTMVEARQCAIER